MTKKALLIGINYLNTEYELSGCINDVTNISKILKEQYHFEDIKLITDNTLEKPNKTIILKYLTEILKNLKKDDVFVFYFSGHGTQIQDDNKDENNGIDEAIYTLDQKIITDDVLFHLISISLGKIYMFFDCCHSGTICDLEYNIKPIDKQKYELWMESKKTLGNVILFSGCLDEQTSADATFQNLKEYNNNGAFTYMLLETLKNHNYHITNKDLLINIYQNIKEHNFTQIPQISFSKLEHFDKPFLL